MPSLAEHIEKFDVCSWASKHGGKLSGSRRHVMVMDCPFCWKKKKLWISVKNKRWKCYVCEAGAGHNLVELVKGVERTDSAGAIAILSNIMTPVKIERVASLYEDGPNPVCEGKKTTVGTKKTGKAWNLRRKPWGPTEVRYPKTFRFLPEEGNEFTRSRNFPNGASTWFRLGVTTGGWLRDRLVFPVFHDEKLIFYAARDMTGIAEKKVLNMPNKEGSARASDVLLNMDRAGLVNDGRVVLVEGLTSAAAYGPDAVASFGKVLNSGQVLRMLEYGYQHVVMAWDGDAKDEAEETAQKLAAVVPVSIAYFPVGLDPSDLGFEESRKIVEKAKAVKLRSVLDLGG